MGERLRGSFACVDQQEWKGRLVAMEMSPWWRAFGGNLRKWPVGCRMGGARFRAGRSRAYDKTRTGRHLGRAGRKGGGERSKMQRIGALFVRASVGVVALTWANSVRWRLKRNRGRAVPFGVIYAFSVEGLLRLDEFSPWPERL